MKKIYCILLLLLFCNVVEAKQVNVPKGTNIEIGVKRVFCSKRIPRNYEIKAIIKDDVIINDVIIFATNSPATIEIGEVQKAAFSGRGAEITLIGGLATDINGQNHRFVLEKEFKAGNDPWLTKWIPFNKGKQVFISPADIFIVQTKRDFSFTTKNN